MIARAFAVGQRDQRASLAQLVMRQAFPLDERRTNTESEAIASGWISGQIQPIYDSMDVPGRYRSVLYS